MFQPHIIIHSYKYPHIPTSTNHGAFVTQSEMCVFLGLLSTSTATCVSKLVESRAANDACCASAVTRQQTSRGPGLCHCSTSTRGAAQVEPLAQLDALGGATTTSMASRADECGSGRRLHPGEVQQGQGPCVRAQGARTGSKAAARRR